MTALADAPPRRPLLFAIALVAAVALIAGGAFAAVRGEQRLDGPAGAVRGYFDALTRGDAPGALAYGTVPKGDRSLLTTRALRDQMGIAPIDDVTVEHTQIAGQRANVRVRYTVSFPGSGQRLTDQVPVERVGTGWRLVQAAIPTQLSLVQAGGRATVAGGGVPEGPVLLFPGAAPVRFDTPYLQLRPSESIVTFRSGPTTQIFPQVSAAGEAAMTHAVSVALQACLGARNTDLRCPQPSGRAIPGTLRGSIIGEFGSHLTVGVGFGAAGVIDMTGTVDVRGTYRKLTFTNRVVDTSGDVQVQVHAEAFAVRPVVVTWERDT